jgi:DNA polymerase-3 subunit delta'
MLDAHKKQWEFIKNKFESEQLSHAYLFTGANGLGKKDFAKQLAELVGCKFPDLMVVEPEGEKEISIAKTREVQNFLSYKSYNGGFKIVIVDYAHLMNQEAQSCFLKTLEEPKGKTLLILISSRPDMLLPTIFSRCQTIKFLGKPILDRQKIEEENKILHELLQVAGGDLSEKFKYAKALNPESSTVAKIVLVLQKYFREKLLSNPSDKKAKMILKLSEEINTKLLFTNANPKLALEILLMEI